MTKNKRYTSDIHRIYDDNEEIACADTMGDAEVIVDLLNEQDNKINELTDENDYLKKKLNLLIEYDQKMYEEVIFKSEDGDIILYKKKGDFNG